MPRDGRTWAALFGFGLINNVIPYSLLTWGQTYIESHEAAILLAATPVFAVVLAHFATHDEKITGAKLAGVTGVTVGVAVLVDPRSLLDGSATSIGALMLIGTALFYACAGIFARRTLAHVPTPMAATGMLTTSSIMMVTVVAAAAGVAFLAEVIVTRTIVGAAIVVVSRALIDGRLAGAIARRLRGKGA